jgi:hypothetical protein
MGPLNREWINENGSNWSLGRIDINGVENEPYGRETSVPAMDSNDWYVFGIWLNKLETDKVLNLSQLVSLYSKETKNKIKWLKEFKN